MSTSDNFHRNTNLPQNANTSTKSPYSHLYEESNSDSNQPKRDPFNKNYVKASTNPFSSNKGNDLQSKPYNQIFSSSSLFNEDGDIKQMYIEKVRNDLNLLPNTYKERLNLINKLFVFSSCVFPLYTIFHIVKDYPSFSEYSRKRIFYASFLYFGMFILINRVSDDIYEKSYKSLREKYSPEAINKMVLQYHSMNTRKTPEDFESNNNINQQQFNTKF